MRVLLVQLPAAAQDYSLVSLLRDFAEDLHRKFMQEGIVEIPDMDSAITELHVVVSAPRHVGDVTTAAKKLLKHYGLTEMASLSKMSATEFQTKREAVALK